jgi:serine/threonine-protein kinase
MEAPKLAPGMQVSPNVRLIEQLGAGGMGAVWLAEHTGLKMRVVVKFMLGGLQASESARSRFEREAEAAAKVKSPHVVHMLDHGVTEHGVPFIAMEHLEGQDLGKELEKKGPLPPERVVAIITQVAKALTKVHGAGLLHRDIKPDNIFLVEGEDDVYVKLLDFGIAKSANSGEHDVAPLTNETKTGQVVGTPFYMSPEQVTAQKTVDARADLWALGVVTFEALTGVRPFDGPSFGALAVMIATGSPPKPSGVLASLPPAFDEWFAKACARDPDARFQTAKALSDGLRTAFDGVVSMPRSVTGDSGPRTAPPMPGRAVVTPRPSDPISVGGNTEVDGRPSFVLASTVEGTGASGEAPALARSEPGRAMPADIQAPARGGRSLGIALVAIVVLAFIGGFAIFKGAPATPAIPQPPSKPNATAPIETAPPKPTLTAIPSATIAPTTTAIADAGHTAPPPTHATATPTGVGTHTRPTASAPIPSAAPSSTTPPKSSGGDILF